MLLTSPLVVSSPWRENVTKLIALFRIDLMGVLCMTTDEFCRATSLLWGNGLIGLSMLSSYIVLIICILNWYKSIISLNPMEVMAGVLSIVNVDGYNLKSDNLL